MRHQIADGKRYHVSYTVNSEKYLPWMNAWMSQKYQPWTIWFQKLSLSPVFRIGNKNLSQDNTARSRELIIYWWKYPQRYHEIKCLYDCRSTCNCKCTWDVIQYLIVDDSFAAVFPLQLDVDKCEVPPDKYNGTSRQLNGILLRPNEASSGGLYLPRWPLLVSFIWCER